MVRYEDLRANPEQVLAPLAEWLGIGLEPVLEALQRTTFESLPAEQRGTGRFARAATPGLWRKNLTREEQAEIEAVIGLKLRELGYPA